jgi:hypothetical protein
MTGDTKKKAEKSAERCIPLGIDNRTARIFAFREGYMAGHAACVRSANKRLGPFINKAVEELKIVEREIGVPSEALKLLMASRS